jgi:DNA polymerase-3 subunit epsilon
MCGSDLLSALERTIQARTGLAVTLRDDDDSLWITVDRFMIVDAITALAARLRSEREVAAVELALSRHSRHARLDIAWRGAPLTPESARAWQRAALPDGMAHPAASFEDMVKRHAGEALYTYDATSHVATFRILLPVSDQETPPLALSGAPSRPTFYDFDLFHQQGQSAELDQCALTRLSYTVFDTETTGLAPSQGDEIVSIGAVRVVNGRLLSHEVFEQFVNPRRRLPPNATRIHGITDEMVKQAPAIERALPAFRRFCEDTVLVAHNAAFDLRFLQLKERETGARFDQPVLDTLMLSAIVYPSHSDHTLETIAHRLGITVVGRHTALGDALLTAEVFLKMLPLLAAKGISTLGEAREASSRTPYARLAY